MTGRTADTDLAVGGTGIARLSQHSIVCAIATEVVPWCTRSTVVGVVAGSALSRTAFLTSQDGLVVDIHT